MRSCIFSFAIFSISDADTLPTKLLPGVELPFFILAALLSLTGLDFITALSGAATSISNVGPGLGPIIGPNGDFSSLPDVSKWILSVGMILGRLELFAILVLFLPSFWRN